MEQTLEQALRQEALHTAIALVSKCGLPVGTADEVIEVAKTCFKFINQGE